MDHHPRMRQRRALACSTGGQQHGAHRSGQSRADGRHIGLHQLHRIVDSQTGRHRSARGIDVNLDILFRIGRLQEQQLCLDDIGRIVVNRSPQKDDAIHHQTRKDVHRRHVQLALLDDRRRHVGRVLRAEIMQFQTIDTAMPGGVFFKFIHNRTVCKLIKNIGSRFKNFSATCLRSYSISRTRPTHDAGSNPAKTREEAKNRSMTTKQTLRE